MLNTIQTAPIAGHILTDNLHSRRTDDAHGRPRGLVGSLSYATFVVSFPPCTLLFTCIHNEHACVRTQIYIVRKWVSYRCLSRFKLKRPTRGKEWSRKCYVNKNFSVIKFVDGSSDYLILIPLSMVWYMFRFPFFVYYWTFYSLRKFFVNNERLCWEVMLLIFTKLSLNWNKTINKNRNYRNIYN